MPQTSLNLLPTTQPSVNFFSRCSESQGKNNKQLTSCHQAIAYEYLAFSLHVVSVLWGFTVIGAQPSKVSLPSSNVHRRNRDFPKALSPLLPSVQKPLVLKYLKKWVLVTKSSVLPQTQLREQSSLWPTEMKKTPLFPMWPELLSRFMMKAKAQGFF